MFDLFWKDISNNSILDYKSTKTLYNEIILCDNIEGSTAEIGVYKGITSKLIIKILNKPHYCYDTFQGIIGSSILYGDNHYNGEFLCNLDEVKENIKSDNVFYKKGWFPETFDEYSVSFCFIYSDTATYLGAKNTFECFRSKMSSGGKIIFYVDDNCNGVKNAINEFEYKNAFIIYNIDNFIIFTKK
jgi:hypothetical protein